ncbi:MAG: hypothetical protein OEW67_05065 [Cyclobacteriaceae bacterium]|nr:hypothetical protein [Cyclobacteriaceae bacterium]
MKKYLLAIFIVGLIIQAYAQENKDKAIELKNRAIELMDNGEFEESLKLLEEAKQQDNSNINIPYETAFAYQLMKKYDMAIEIAKPLLKHADVNDQVYQLIGNCYDLMGDKGKAIKYYDKGLKKFPNSGKLYLEKGVVIASQNNWMEALDIWEQGIIADPLHSSNYYYASQVLSQTNEKIWGIYYGEMFINLESNSARTNQISELLFNTYQQCLPINNNNWGLDFSRKATNIVLGSIKDFKLSFETVHNLAMEQGYKNVSADFNIQNLVKIRRQFLIKWNEDYANQYSNLIFDYHNLLIQNEFFDAYYYWIFKEGRKDEFDSWVIANNKLFDDFTSWFNENKMFFNDRNKTNRYSYK